MIQLALTWLMDQTNRWLRINNKIQAKIWTTKKKTRGKRGDVFCKFLVPEKWT